MTDGLDLDQFELSHEFLVKTHNSVYHFKHINNRWHVIGGVRFQKTRFNEYTPVEIIGCNVQHNMKKHWVCCQCCLEFYDILHDCYVKTSAVESITIMD